MQNTIITQESNGMQSLWCSTPQFKTSRLSVHMILPLSTPQLASVRAFVPNVITRVTREYPDYTEFGKYLAKLYGASIQAGVSRIGDNQILTIASSGIANRYAFAGEDIQRALAEIIESAVFTPLLDADGQLPAKGFAQEKRQLIEMLDAEFNEKQIYARNRCTEIMFAGEAAGIPHLGTRQTLLDVTREQVKSAWENVAQSAQICQFNIGDGANGQFAEQFAQRRSNSSVSETKSAAHRSSAPTKVVEENMPLAQSKLVMGFRTDGSQKNQLATKLMAVIFGGTPSAKLFVNVREKESLCYYCSARHDMSKDVVFVESGVETKNLERAEEAVLREFSSMQKGDISQDEILHAKLAMSNSYNSIADSAGSMEGWYLSGMLRRDMRTPEEVREILMQITKEDIVDAARGVMLDTVYKLKGDSEGV